MAPALRNEISRTRRHELARRIRQNPSNRRLSETRNGLFILKTTRFLASVFSALLAKNGLLALALARLECALKWPAFTLQGSVLPPTRHRGRMRPSRSNSTKCRMNRN